MRKLRAKMKVLILVDYIEGYKCESAFTVRYKTAKQISQNGHDVTLIAPSLSSKRIIERKDSEALRVVYTPGLFPARFRKGGFSLIDIVFKIKYILTHRYDVIHVTSGHRPAQLIPCLIGKFFSNSVIIDEWWEWFGKGGIADTRKNIIGQAISKYDTLMELPTKAIYDGVIAIASILKNRLKNNSHITILHGGSENSNLIELEKNDVRTKLNLNKDLFIVGMSNVSEEDWEDNKLFFDAFENIQEKFDNIRLFITGDSKYIGKFLSQVSYKDKIIYSGWLNFEVYNQYLSACDLFVLPYKNSFRNAGRWPNKIGDYLCLNRPIITNPTGDLKELFTNYKIGFLCEETVESFTNILEDIMLKKIDIKFYRKDAHYLSSNVLSFNKRVDNMLCFYKKCIKGRNN